MYCFFNKCSQRMIELNNSKYFAGIMMLVLIKSKSRTDIE